MYTFFQSPSASEANVRQPRGAPRWRSGSDVNWTSRAVIPIVMVRQKTVVPTKEANTMYAVFEDGSRQYRVQEGDVVNVDYRDVQKGASIEFARVLFVQQDAGAKVGQPTLAGARVVGEVVDFPSIKVTVQHFKRRKNERRFKGHRQPYVAVKIKQIVAS